MAQPDQWTSKKSILVTTAAEGTVTVIPKGDLKDYLQTIVGSNTEVTLKNTNNDKETIVLFDSENAVRKVLSKTHHQVSQPYGKVFEFSVKSCPSIHLTKYLKADGASAGSTTTSSTPSGGTRSSYLEEAYGRNWEESGARSPEPEGSSQEEWDGRTIEVYGFDPLATGDAIVLLFENNFPSGDVTVQSVQRRPDENVTYLTFETAEVTKKALSLKVFSPDGTTVQPTRGVKPESLVLVPVSFHESQDSKSAEKVPSKQDHSDKGASLRGQPKQPHPTHQEKRPTEQDVSETHLQNWDQRTIEVRNVRPNTPKETFIKCFQDKNLCQCGGEVEEVDTSNQSRGIVYVKFKEPGVVSSVLSQKSMRVEGVVVDVAPCLSKTPAGAPAQLTTGKTSAINTGSNKPQEKVGIHLARKPVTLELHQLRMLHAMRFKTAQKKKLPGMAVTILAREHEIIFHGKKSDIEAAEEAMYGIVNKMKHSPLEMSAHLIRLMRGITMITHVVKVFKRKEICAVYVAAGDTKLEVFAPSDEDLRQAINVIKDETCEECVDAGSTDILQTLELKEKLLSYDKGLLAITESVGCIILSGIMDLVARAKCEILNLLAEIKGCRSGGNTGRSTGGSTVEGGELDKAIAEAGTRPKYPMESHQNQPSTQAPWTSASVQHSGGNANQLEHRGATGGAASHSSSDNDTQIQIGPLKIEIVQGDLTKQQTGAIVNSTDKSFSRTGATSWAIVEAGGQSIVRECEKIGTIPSTGIAVTGAGNLPCSSVIHVEARFDTDWTSIINKVLVKAEQLCIESVALPALGTGALRLTPHDVAKHLLEAINLFSHSNPIYMRLVRIVIFEQTMVESFRKCFLEKAITSRATTTVFCSSHCTADARVTQSVATPYKQSSTTFQERRGVRGGAAGHSSRDSDTSIHIGPVRIEIVQGDLTTQETGAIVNSTDKYFTLSGATAMAIVKAAGQSVVQECKKFSTMPSSGIAVTGPGNIPCSCIIHIDARMDLTSVVNNVLDEAERRQIESVAFPALGTGVLKQTPFEAANNMLQAIKHFVKSHTVNYLRLVRIVIFEQNMMESFRRCFLEKTNTSGTTQPVFSSSHRNGPDAGVHTGPKKQPVVQVQWRYDDGNGIGFQDYREEINIKLETIYASKKKAKPFEWTDDTHVKHKVYFDGMKDVCNSTERVVRRTVMFDDIMLPYSWSPMESYDQCKVEEVKASSEEYSKVQKTFMRAVDKSATIKKIQRVQNPSLYHQYALCREQMKIRREKTRYGTQEAISRQLWHMGSADSVSHINANGFSRRGRNAADTTRVFCSTVRPSWTKGKKLKHVYQSAVLTGACTEDNPDCYDAPFDHRNPGDRFDSVTNQGTFVVFSRAQAYPQYLIMFC